MEVLNLETDRSEKYQNQKVSELQCVRIRKSQNQKVSESESVELGSDLIEKYTNTLHHPLP